MEKQTKIKRLNKEILKELINRIRSGKMLKGFLAVVVFITAVAVVELSMYGKLGLQHAPVGTFIVGTLYFFLLYFFILLFSRLAIKNENNNVSLYLFSGIALILLILAVGSAIYLSVKYIEFTILLTFFLVNVFINVLTNILANKEKPTAN